MIVLALDTALAATSVAVIDGERTLAVRSEPMERGHQERLAGLVRDAMADAGVGFDALARIGVTVGPGSFTGLRVGLAFAKGLSLALNIPCVGVGTLQALAASSSAAGTVIATVDARREQLYIQAFRGGAAVAPPQAMTVPEAQVWLGDLNGAPLTLIGSGAEALMSGPGVSIDKRLFADPVALARLALAAPEPLARPEPLYLRAPDAKTIAERAAGL